MANHGPAIICLCLLFGGNICGAQETSSDAGLFNWYYAAIFGTGVYRSGDHTVTVFNLPFSHTVHEATPQQSGIRLTLPVTLGIHDFQALDVPDSEQLGTVSIMPGAEFPMLMSDNWTLTPYVNLGIGLTLNAGDDDGDAMIYAAGVKSRWHLPLGDSEFMLGNTLDYVGYEPEEGAAQTTTRLVIGFNLFTPITELENELADEFGLHLIYYYYFKGAKITQPLSGGIDALHNEVEFALTLGKHKGWNLFGLRLDQIGIGLRGGSNLSAIRLITGFPY